MDPRVPELHPDRDTELVIVVSRSAASSRPEVEIMSAESHGKTDDKERVPGSSQELGTNSKGSEPDTRASQDNPPSGVSMAMWQKFQALQNKRAVMTKSSRESRIKEVQQETLAKVQSHFNSEDLKILNEHVSTDAVPSSSRKRPLESTEAVSGESSQGNASNGEDWSSVKKYIDVNKHLSGIDQGRHAPKTRLEGEIDAAIQRADFARAESLSDDLANRDFGKKIADAFDAKRYIEQKQRADALQGERKKRKVAWRFDHKERWETKGNM